MHRYGFIVLVLSITVDLWSVNCASILAVLPLPTRSHFILGDRYLNELARRGHDVIVVNTFSNDNITTYYKNIVLDGISKMIQKNTLDSERLIDLGKRSTFYKFRSITRLGTTLSEKVLEHPKFQKLLASDETYDLVIFDLLCVEALMGLAYRFNCPIIGIDTYPLPYLTNHLVGNPASFSYSPNILSYHSTNMNIYERFSNTLVGLICEFYKNYVLMPRHETLLKQYFKGAPSLNEIIYNKFAMILLNHNPSITGSMPTVPAVIPVGGFHVEEPKALPKELQEFLDDAKEGVILFSLGSSLKSANLPTDKRNIILKTFAKFNLKILWKFEDENFSNISDNVKIQKWLPQSDILAHPNIKIFITHGGLLSVTESIYHGVPIIGIPAFVDQHMNMAIAVEKGYGLQILYDELTEETFTTAIRKMTKDPQYRHKAKALSRTFRDRPMKPMDEAVFWTEHVIRHKGAHHLRSPSMDLHWTQLYLLDIICLNILTCTLLYFLITKCVKIICQNNENGRNLKKKKT